MPTTKPKKRSWKILKQAKHMAAIVDFDKMLLNYDREKYWIRFETKKRIYIYSLKDKKLLNALKKLPCSHCQYECEPFRKWKKRYLGADQ